MAQLGRLHIVVQDDAGNALNGVSVEVRKQGATIVSGGDTSFTVNDPGAVAAADVVAVNTGATTRSVSSVTATNVTVGAPGFSGTVDDDRITITSGLPSLYNDATGTESKTNPLTTDATGEAVCWVEIAPYDIYVSGGSATTELRQDYIPEGHETITSNAITTGSQVAYIRDTQRALASGDKHTSLRDTTTEIFSVDYQGGFTAAQASTITTGGLTISAGGATITGNSTIAGTLGSLTGLTVASGGASIIGDSTVTGGLTVTGTIAAQGTAAKIYAGAGTPESSITAEIGSIYLRTDGGSSTSIYVKESGSGNTGWVGK